MKSFKAFISEDTVTHGYTTQRHADGYDWEVHKWEHGKDKKSVHSGKEATREKAVEKAKKHYEALEKAKAEKMKKAKKK